MYYSMSFVPCELGGNGHFDILTPDKLGDLLWVRNTWVHWHIVPVERYAILPPDLKTDYVDVSGYNGKLDLTQALTPYPTYKNRSGTIKFAVLNGYRNWQTAYTDVMTWFHGKRMFMVYEEDPEYYYVGRWVVNKWQSNKTRSEIAIDYDLEPYKWRLYDAQGAWLWDPFNFNTGVIASRGNYYNLYNVHVDSDITEETLLYTQAYYGNLVEDSIGSGYFNAQENVSDIIGNAPVPLKFNVLPDEDSYITINYTNPEILDDAVSKTYNRRSGTTAAEGAVIIENDPDFMLTNWTGSNAITLAIKGHGRVSVNFRPGRL